MVNYFYYFSHLLVKCVLVLGQINNEYLLLGRVFQMKNEFVIGLLQPLGLFHLDKGFWWLVFSRKSRC